MSKRALYIFIIGVLTAALLSLAVQPCYAEDIPSTGWEWVWFNETKLNNSVQYRGFYENKIDYRNEFVYTYQDPEEVNGKTYLVMYDMILDSTTGFYVYMIHLRQEGKRVLVIYDEYKKLMEARGYDMTDFDENCRYEVTPEGELVLYDFNMSVGDKFRSVPGKDDITIVKKGKAWFSYSHYTNQNTYDVFYLSNGSMIIENIGYLNIDAPSENNSISGSFFDYLNLTEGYRIYMTLSLFGGKYIFDDILDGGTNGIEAVPAWNRFDRSGKVYDLNGRALKSTPASGIYIRNGKKFVVK